MFATLMLMFLRYWKENLFNREDWVWAKNILKIINNHEVEDTGRYNLGQKCVFWAAIISLLLLHSLAAVGLIIVIMVHIYAALWIKGTITAMVEGWVPAAWAKLHHPRWYRKVREKQQENTP